MAVLEHGDFTPLAEDYSKYRPDYAPVIPDLLLGALGRPAATLRFVDVGAGTGIWTRQMAAKGMASVTAVEPNDAMREQGRRHPDNGGIRWLAGAAESTDLPTGSADLVTMASSFHWTDPDTAITEFSRVLSHGGCFAALWNPRITHEDPLLARIEAHLDTLRPGIRRVSSGRSGITETLTARLESSGLFSAVAYAEARHTIRFTPQRYLGAWRSVNDLRVQLGPDRFEQFLDFVTRQLAAVDEVHATYLTRVWIARR